MPYLISSSEPPMPEYVVAHGASPYFEFYTADFVRLTEYESIFAALPSAPNWCDYRGKYVAFAGVNYLIVFNLFALTSVTASSETYTLYSCDFAPDMTYLATGIGSYAIDTWSKAVHIGGLYSFFTPDSTLLIVGTSSGSKYYPKSTWSPTSFGGIGYRYRPHTRNSGDYVAIGKNTSPYIDVWSVPGFVRNADPSSLPPGTVTCPKFTPDGTILAVGGASYLRTYTFSGMTISTPGTQPAGTVSCMLFPDNQSMILLTNDANPALLYSTSTWTASNLTSIKNGSCISKRK